VQLRFYNFFNSITTITLNGKGIQPDFNSNPSAYQNCAISGDTPTISFKVNDQAALVINGPFSYTKYSVFLYKNTANNNAAFVFLPDEEANPIDHAEIYQDDTLWR